MTSSPPLGPGRPELSRALLWSFALFLSAAASLAAATLLVDLAFETRYAFAASVLLILVDVGILFVFGRYLIHRLVLRPMAGLIEAAEGIAAGDLHRRAPPAETADFNKLANRINVMTEALLDAQSQLVRAEKLASVGRLAAGVAHEIGNPLAAIQNYVAVLERRGGDGDVTEALAREAHRIDEIVRGLLTYARPAQDGPGRVGVEGVLRGAVELLENQGVLRDCRVTLQIDHELPDVAGRAHVLEQVIVNLLLNAVDAAPDGPLAAGAVRRTADRRSEALRHGEAPPAPPRGPSGRRPWRPELAASGGVLLYVADAGPGVPEEDRERVFDPFYTTKDPGRGTGLGLAIVQRTVHEMGGVVWVEQAREGGAAFKVFLPAAPPAERPGQKGATP